MKTVYNSRILLPTPRHRAARRTADTSVPRFVRSSARYHLSLVRFFALRGSRALRLGSRRLASRVAYSFDGRSTEYARTRIAALLFSPAPSLG